MKRILMPSNWLPMEPLRPACCGLMLLLLLLCGADASAELRSVSLDQSSLKLGEAVMLTVSGKGKVGIESDVAQKSSVHDLGSGPSTTVNVGILRAPGVYAIRLIDNQKQVYVVEFLALRAPRGASTVEILSRTVKLTKAEGLSEDTLKRFWNGVSKERLKRATEKAVKSWLPANISALGTTAVMCTVCIVPGGQAACPVCVSSAAGNVVDLGLEVTTQLAYVLAEDGVISKKEAGDIVHAIQLGQSAFALVTAANKYEAAIALGGIAVDYTVDNVVFKVALGNVKDQASKTQIFIRVLKKSL